MGSIFGKLLSSFMSKPEMRILMVGLDAAGKVGDMTDFDFYPRKVSFVCTWSVLGCNSNAYVFSYVMLIGLASFWMCRRRFYIS